MNTQTTQETQTHQPVNTGTQLGANAPIAISFTQEQLNDLIKNIIGQTHCMAQNKEEEEERRREEAMKNRQFNQVNREDFKKEWKKADFTGRDKRSGYISSDSQNFDKATKSDDKPIVSPIDPETLQNQHSGYSETNVLWFDLTDGQLYIGTNEHNCSDEERKRRQRNPNANTLGNGDIVRISLNGSHLQAIVVQPGPVHSMIRFENGATMYAQNMEMKVLDKATASSSKLGLPTLGEIVPLENRDMLETFLDGVKTFTISINNKTEFLLFYTEGAKTNIATQIRNGEPTRFSANILYSKMGGPRYYGNWVKGMQYNDKKNSFMSVQHFLMYLNSVNGHYRKDDKGTIGTNQNKLFIPECDKLLVLVKTLVVNFNVNREKSIPHNLPYFDCDGALPPDLYEKHAKYHTKQWQEEIKRTNDAITAWSTCTPVGPVDMFGKISNGSGYSIVPGYGSSPFGKTGGAADGLSQLGFF